MKNSKSNEFNQVEYINKYKKIHYKRIEVLIPIDSGIDDRLESMQSMTGKSRNQLVLEAVKEYLDRHFI